MSGIIKPDDSNWCESCGHGHGELYICEHYTEDRKQNIRKSIPIPPEEYLFKTPEGEYIVWVSDDKKHMVGWGEALFLGGYHLFRRIGETDIYEQPNYMTIYTSIESAKEAIK